MSRRGGTGRRAGLKIRWAKVRVGSTPTAGTTLSMLFILLLLGLLSVKSFSSTRPSPFEINGLVGSMAPDFAIEDLKGDKISLSMFRGRPVLLNIWATWCPYCREERPELNSLYKKYSETGLIVIAVSIDHNTEKVKTYLEDVPVDYMVLIDKKGIVARLYKVYALPTSILIDREGRIKKVLMGSRRWLADDPRTMIEALLME